MSLPKEDLIGALVLKAKEGGAESENARRALQRLCDRHNLDFDEVMEGADAVEEHMVEYKRGHYTIMAQIVLRYGTTEKYQDVMVNKRARAMFFKGTKQQYIEVLNAYEILAPLFNKEKKKIMDVFEESFVHKHKLYRQYSVPKQIGDEPEKSFAEKMEEMKRGALIGQMTGSMEDAEINPRLQSGE